MKKLFVVPLILLCTCAQAYYLSDAELLPYEEGVKCELLLRPEQKVVRLRVRLVWQKSSEQTSFRESAFVFYHPRKDLKIKDLCSAEGMDRLVVKVYLQINKERAKLVEILEY